MKLPIIAIDGYSATGKSSVAKDLANILNFKHIDSGAMYRAITYYGITHFFDNDLKRINITELNSNLNKIKLNFKYNIIKSINEIYLNGLNIESKIRTFEVSQNVSLIAKNKIIRNFLIKQQQDLGKNGGIVMDGRDIASVVFPEAEFKFFITASIEQRVNRRFLELSPTNITKKEIETNLLERDKQDINREFSPLIQVPDAIIIDNTFINKKQTLELIIKHINLKNII